MLDHIEKEIILRAPVARVWHALTDIAEFGQWFGVRLDQPFAPGQTITGTYESEGEDACDTQCQVPAGLAPTTSQPPLPRSVFCTVERMDAPELFSFRWIPYDIDAGSDPAMEPTTLIQFRLEALAEKTRLTITESGFASLPPHRRDRAFLMNDGGWSKQIENIRRHVEPS